MNLLKTKSDELPKAQAHSTQSGPAPLLQTVGVRVALDMCVLLCICRISQCPEPGIGLWTFQRGAENQTSVLCQGIVKHGAISLVPGTLWLVSIDFSREVMDQKTREGCLSRVECGKTVSLELEIWLKHLFFRTSILSTTELHPRLRKHSIYLHAHFCSFLYRSRED